MRSPHVSGARLLSVAILALTVLLWGFPALRALCDCPANRDIACTNLSRTATEGGPFNSYAAPASKPAIRLATPTPGPTPTAVQVSPTYPTADALEIYKAVAEQAIDAARHSATWMSVVLTAMGLFLLAGIGVGGLYLQRVVSDISQKTEEAQKASLEAVLRSETAHATAEEVIQKTVESQRQSEASLKKVRVSSKRARKAKNLAKQASLLASEGSERATIIQGELDRATERVDAYEEDFKNLSSEMTQAVSRVRKIADAAFYLTQARDEDPDTRLRAYQNLSQLGLGDLVRPTQLRGLQDEDHRIRAEAAYGLGRTTPSTQATVDSLIRASRDQSFNVRRECAESLGKTGLAHRNAAVQRLAEMAGTDLDDTVRQAAQKALDALSDE